MNKLDEFITKLNFKKTVRYYIAFSIILLIACISAVAYMSRDKIFMALDYVKISDSFKKEGVSDNLKSYINELASDSRDVNNIIILDKNNNVVYKVNNNVINDETNLQLQPYIYEKSYLEDNINKNIMYKIVPEENMILNSDYIRNNQEIAASINKDFFYERDINSKQVLLLNYLVDSSTGNKVFILRTASPIPHAERLLEITGTSLGIIAALYWVGLALWVYKDAMKKKVNPSLWGIIVLLTNLVGLIVYIMLKQSSRICYECGTMQSKENIFCTECGVELNNQCKECDNIIVKSDNYCSRCGTKL